MIDITKEHIQIVLWRQQANVAMAKVELYFHKHLFSEDDDLGASKFGKDPRWESADQAIRDELVRLWTKVYLYSEGTSRGAELRSGVRQIKEHESNFSGHDSEVGSYQTSEDKERNEDLEPDNDYDEFDDVETAELVLNDAREAEIRFLELGENGELKHWRDVGRKFELAQEHETPVRR